MLGQARVPEGEEEDSSNSASSAQRDESREASVGGIPAEEDGKSEEGEGEESTGESSMESRGDTEGDDDKERSLSLNEKSSKERE